MDMTFMDSMRTDLEVKIKYCPMCGKKLKDI